MAAEITQQGGRAIALPCDVADPAQHLAAFQRHAEAWGRLDYALLNAGGGRGGWGGMGWLAPTLPGAAAYCCLALPVAQVVLPGTAYSAAISRQLAASWRCHVTPRYSIRDFLMQKPPHAPGHSLGTPWACAPYLPT